MIDADDLIEQLKHYKDRDLSPEETAQLVADTLATLARLMEKQERFGFKNSVGHERVKAGLERAALAMRPTLH